MKNFSTLLQVSLLCAASACGCSDNAASSAGQVGGAGASGTSGASGASPGGSAAGGLSGSAGASAGAAGASGAAGVAGGGTGGASGGGASGGGASGGGASGGGAGGGSGAGGAAPVSDWQFYGRWDLSKSGKAVTVNSGSHVTAKFNGTGISAKFDISGNTGNIPTVSINIDGAPVVEKEIAATLELASGLTPGMHDITLFVRGMNEYDARWTPPLVASTVFLGFTVMGGAIVPTPRPKRVKIEFLGDSITEGVNLHSMGPQGQTSANWRTDGPRGYAALTALKLGVEWRQVGFGRQGLTVVGNGGVPKAQDAFNWFYSGVPRDDWQADVVVVNQGTNDQGSNGQTFAPLYGAFLGEIRAAYAGAKIVAMRPFGGAFAAEIKAQVEARKTGGDAKVYYIDTSGWTSAADFTDGVHPNQAGSVKIRDQLVTALQPILN